MKISTEPILIVGSPETYPDMEYATGFTAPDPVVLLETARETFLIVSQLEHNRAKRVCADHAAQTGSGAGRAKVEVLTPELLRVPPGRRRISDWIITLLKRERIRRVRVPGYLPHAVARRLERSGVAVKITRAELYPRRAVKSRAEIRKIREAQQAAVIAMRAATALIASANADKDGFLKLRGRRLTAADVKRTITRVLVDHDCFCSALIVAGGRQSADPHEKGDGFLLVNEPIVMDIFPRHMAHNYWGDLTRTVVRGQASRVVKRMYKAVKAAQSAALDAIKPGVKCSTVHRKAVREFKKRGFETGRSGGRFFGFIHSTGHGVGLSIHEAPAVGPGPARLKAGNVITVEPGLYYPEVGGMRIEDTVVVTPAGWDYLVPCEKRLEI